MWKFACSDLPTGNYICTCRFILLSFRCSGVSAPFGFSLRVTHTSGAEIERRHAQLVRVKVNIALCWAEFAVHIKHRNRGKCDLSELDSHRWFSQNLASIAWIHGPNLWYFFVIETLWTLIKVHHLLMATSWGIMLRVPKHFKLVSWTSDVNPAPAWGHTGDWQHECAADKCETMWCSHFNTERNLRGRFPMSWIIEAVFSEQREEPPSITLVFLIKCSVSVYMSTLC